MNIHLKGLATVVGALFALWITMLYVDSVDVKDATADVLVPASPDGTTVAGDLVSGLTSEEIRQLQTLLDASGIDPGPIDGLIGPSTQVAIEEGKTLMSLPDSATSAELLEELQRVQDAFLSDLDVFTDAGN